MKKCKKTDKEGVIQEAIDSANEDFKSNKVRVRLLRSRDSLYVQFTAPLMPGDTQESGRSNKQYKKSLGFKATTNGVRRAYAKARELGDKLEHNQFKWEEYPDWLKQENLSTQPEPPKKIKELLEIFEKEYFLKKKRNRQSEKTFSEYKDVLKRNLNIEEPLTRKSIDELIAQTNAGSAKRYGLVRVLSVFCRQIKFEYDFRGLKGGYKPKARNLPSDEEIIENWRKIQVDKRRFGNGKSWGWAFGMIATYGLRPHELPAIDHQKSLKPPHYEVYIDADLTDGTKTGSRTVYPLPLEWIDDFDLLAVKKECFINLDCNSIANRLSIRFHDRDLDFLAYDLRHCYAIRGHQLEVPIGQMAKWMGHSVQMHSQIYQKWMQASTHKMIYEQVLDRAKKRQVITESKPSYEDLVRKNAELEEKVNQLAAQAAERNK